MIKKEQIYMKEEWKDIEGYEGFYQVSNKGRVKSLPRTVKKRGIVELKGRILRPKIDKEGYLLVGLHKDGKQKFMSVHRLVARAFILNQNNYPQVNHIDEDKSNNYVFNLEWCTNKYNVNYGTCIERMRRSKMKKVAQYTLEGRLVKIWDSITSVQKEMGWSLYAISLACTGVTKSSKGFLWKYLDD